MKIEVLQENLKIALISLQKAIPAKPQLPILSSILLEVENSVITLSATDLYLGIKTKVTCSSSDTGKIVLPGEIFKKLILSLPAGKINLELKESTLKITTESSKTSLSCQSPEEYPDFPQIEGDSFTLPVSDFKEIESFAAFAASTDQTRPVLTTLLFNFKEDSLEIVGTDGFRLAILKHEAISGFEDSKVLLPVKAVKEVLRIANQQKTENIAFTISHELKQVLFTVEGSEIYVRMMEGEYPPYMKIVPDSYSIEIEMDGVEFGAQIKRAMVFSSDSSNIIKLSFDNEKLTITASSPASGEYIGELPIKNTTGEKGEIAFNATYVQDFIQAVKPESITLKMNESLKPAMIKPTGKEDYQYIIMPFRVNS